MCVSRTYVTTKVMTKKKTFTAQNYIQMHILTPAHKDVQFARHFSHMKHIPNGAELLSFNDTLKCQIINVRANTDG
jgi:hypothetical protein